jgi:hypothetical protein
LKEGREKNERDTKRQHERKIQRGRKGERETHNILEMSKLVKFLSLSNPLELCSHHFSSRLHRPVGIIKDPTVWLDGAIPPQISLIMSWANW